MEQMIAHKKIGNRTVKLVSKEGLDGMLSFFVFIKENDGNWDRVSSSYNYQHEINIYNHYVSHMKVT